MIICQLAMIMYDATNIP